MWRTLVAHALACWGELQLALRPGFACWDGELKFAAAR
jgi:hypothetical protein